MFIVRYGSDLRIENGGGACMYIRAYATSVAASSRSSSPPPAKKKFSVMDVSSDSLKRSKTLLSPGKWIRPTFVRA